MPSYFLKDVKLWLTPSSVENITQPNKYVCLQTWIFKYWTIDGALNHSNQLQTNSDVFHHDMTSLSIETYSI